MGSCSSHSMVEVRIRSVTVSVKVPQLKNICQSTIYKRRKAGKKQSESRNRQVLRQRNF